MIESANPHFIDGSWQPGGGESLSAENPSTGQVHWRGASAGEEEIDRVVCAARRAQPGWAALPEEERAGALKRFAALLEARKERMAEAISTEVGKPHWEALGEVGAMIAKAELTIEAQRLRCATLALRGAVTRFRPHGVVAVLGPFNFPGHLPNGHIMPALLAGNCVIFKPSDKVPWVAEEMVRLWEEAGLPSGVLQLLQGGVETAEGLTGHAGLDGLFFTGSTRVGLALNQKFAGRPGVILALELGGNNAMILHRGIPIEQAVPIVLQAAFASGGQRCNCTRRLILTPETPPDFLPALVEAARRIRTGPPDARPEAYYGPLIRAAAVDAFLAGQEGLAQRGARCLLEGRALPGPGYFVSPGIWEVTEAEAEPDEEIFAPLLKIFRASDFSAALAEAGRTRYGLAAGLLSNRVEDWEEARAVLRVGVLNWNQPTTAASSAASFGGVGQSGNHRPGAYFAADYCSYPVASLESPAPVVSALPPGLMD